MQNPSWTILFLRTRPIGGESMKEAIANTMDEVQVYMKANRLQLNPQKSQIMLISKNSKMNKWIWNCFKQQDSIPQAWNGSSREHLFRWPSMGQSCQKSPNTIAQKPIAHIKKCRQIFAQRISRAILQRNIPRKTYVRNWNLGWSVLKFNIANPEPTKQSFAKLALSEHYKLNSNQRHKLLHWFSINREVESAVYKHTYKIIHWNQPEELASQMPPNVNGRRLAAQFKLACKPKWLGSNKMTRSTLIETERINTTRCLQAWLHWQISINSRKHWKPTWVKWTDTKPNLMSPNQTWMSPYPTYIFTFDLYLDKLYLPQRLLTTGPFSTYTISSLSIVIYPHLI